MKLSSPLFVVLSSVVGNTVLIAAEPCANSGGVNGGYEDDNYGGYPTDGYGVYDMTACNACAENGNGQTGHSVCCNALYRHSRGRDDDDWDDHESLSRCIDLNDVTVGCTVGQGECYPGLFCAEAGSYGNTGSVGNCQLPEDNPEAPAAAASLVTSSSTSNTTKEGHSFVVVVSLLGAAMMATKVILQRHHRVLFRRHQYNEVDATATRMDV